MRVEEHAQQALTPLVERAQRHANRVLLLESGNYVLGERLPIWDIFSLLVEHYFTQARGIATDDRAPGQAPGRGNDPCTHPLWIVQTIEVLHECGEYLLKNVGRRVLVQASTQSNGMHQALVAAHQQLPGGLVAGSARPNKSAVARLDTRFVEHLLTERTDWEQLRVFCVPIGTPVNTVESLSYPECMWSAQTINPNQPCAT